MIVYLGFIIFLLGMIYGLILSVVALGCIVLLAYMVTKECFVLLFTILAKFCMALLRVTSWLNRERIKYWE